MHQSSIHRDPNISSNISKELELNGLEDEPLVKTQIAVMKKAEKNNKKQNEKSKRQTPKTVPNMTLINDQSCYCKEAGHMMTDCPKLTKWQT